MVCAENYLVLIGGGGEPEGDSTIFDGDLKNLGKSLENIKSNTEVLFNGGHKKTEEIIKNNYSKSDSLTKSFTSENYKKLIESYKLKIENNVIKSGDQLVIFIYSHGAERQSGKLSHEIASSGGAYTNLNNLDGSTLVNLDDLQEIIQLTNKKGIQLGIVDLSCHSGSTLALKEKAPNTCIVSSTGPDHFAYAGRDSFTDLFLKGLKPGLSLEEIFLKARLESRDPGYPMISTNIDDKNFKNIYTSITPYLYFSEKLTPYLLSNISGPQFCEREEGFKYLISQIEGLQSAVNSKYQSLSSEQLRGVLKTYKNLQEQILKISTELSSDELNKIEHFPIPSGLSFDLSDTSDEITWGEMLETDFDEIITEYENDMKSSSSKKEEQEYKLMIKLITEISNKKKKILKENPHLEAYKSQVDLLDKYMKKSEDLASVVAKHEKSFYQELYLLNQKPNSTDPCKNIKL